MKSSLPAIFSLALVLGLAVPTLWALPAIDKEWKERYIEKNPPPAFQPDAVAQKCNVCHEGNIKKNKNEYGKAVGKHLTKKGVSDLKDNLPAQKKFIQDALEKAEAERNSKGEKFGDRMKEGKLPGS